MAISKTKNQYAVKVRFELVHKIKKTFRTLYLTYGWSPFDVGYDTLEQAKATAEAYVGVLFEKFNGGVRGIYHFDEKSSLGHFNTVELSPKDYTLWNYEIIQTKLIEAKGIAI
jgi:hypothetical protein